MKEFFKNMFLFRTYFPRGIMGRMMVLIILPLLLSQALSGMIFYQRYHTNVANQSATLFAGNVLTIVDLMKDVAGDTQKFAELSTLARRNYSLNISFVNGAKIPDHYSVPARLNELSLKYLRRFLDQNLVRPYSLSVDERARQFEVQIQYSSGVLVISSRLSNVFQRTLYIFFYWIVGSIVIFSAIAIFFMRSQVRSIKDLTKAIERAGRGEDISDFKPSGPIQIRRAGRKFEQTYERNVRYVAAQKKMLSGVSHDLKTPLTRLKLEAEMFSDEAARYAVNMESDEINKMIDAYLSYAKNMAVEPSESISMNDLVKTVVRKLSRGKAKVEVIAEKGKDYKAVVRPVAMERALSNIVQNALRYGKGKVEIKLSTRKDSDGEKFVVITVDDDGPGIPKDRRDDMFKPFARMDESRSKDGGVGLGLSIVQEIIYQHGGEVFLEDSPSLGGLRVRTEIPV